MRVINSVIRYFDLYSERRSDLAEAQAQDDSPSKGIFSLLALYLCALLGVASKIFVDPGGASLRDLSWPRVILSLVITTMIFPAIYKQTLEKSNLHLLLRSCLAFGGGFGYKALID